MICTPSRVLKPQRTEQQSNEESEASPPGYHERDDQEVLTEKPIVISCTRGKCMGIDLETGEGIVILFRLYIIMGRMKGSINLCVRVYTYVFVGFLRIIIIMLYS